MNHNSTHWELTSCHSLRLPVSPWRRLMSDPLQRHGLRYVDGGSAATLNAGHKYESWILVIISPAIEL